MASKRHRKPRAGPPPHRPRFRQSKRLTGSVNSRPPPLRAAPIAADKIDTTVPGPDHPPGYYGPSGAAHAFNLVTAKTELKPLKANDAAGAVSGYTLKKPRALEPWLYLAALAIFAIDVLAVLMLSTGLRLRRRVAATSAVILLALTLLPQASLRLRGRAGSAQGHGKPRRRLRAQGLASDAPRLRHYRRPRYRSRQRGRFVGSEQGVARPHRARAGRPDGQSISTRTSSPSSPCFIGRCARTPSPSPTPRSPRSTPS